MVVGVRGRPARSGSGLPVATLLQTPYEVLGVGKTACASGSRVRHPASPFAPRYRGAYIVDLTCSVANHSSLPAVGARSVKSSKSPPPHESRCRTAIRIARL